MQEEVIQINKFLDQEILWNDEIPEEGHVDDQIKKLEDEEIRLKLQLRRLIGKNN